MRSAWTIFDEGSSAVSPAPGALLVVVLVLGTVPLGAQPQGTPDLEALGRTPWPGMTAWDVAWCKELVFAAGVVEIREPGHAPRLVWLKDVRGWKKPNGFYGLRINGQVVDEQTVWLAYAGTLTNLQALFTYGSSGVGPAFRD